MKTLELPAILAQARNGYGLSRDEVLFLLKLGQRRDIEALFETARYVRHAYSGEHIFLYGFLYTSTHCRNNCRFCKFRRDNGGFTRYRKDNRQILDAAVRLAESGVHLIDLTMGEDPALFRQGTGALAELVHGIRKATGLPVMVSPGVLPPTALQALATAGADWYACYQETHSRTFFQTLRTGQDFDGRMAAKTDARQAGMLVEEGILCGVGESDLQVADSLEAMAALDADQVRVMNFVPQPGTPLARNGGSDNLRERIIIAVMRLAFPDKLIPASLDVEGLEGLQHRLDAGANVVTSLVPPGEGFSGVASSQLDIDNARRSTGSARRVIEACGLAVATPSLFGQWMASRRQAGIESRRAGRPA